MPTLEQRPRDIAGAASSATGSGLPLSGDAASAAAASTRRRKRSDRDGCARRGPGFRAPRRRLRGECAQRRLQRAGVAATADGGGERRQRLEREHVVVARLTERVREPAQFHAQRLDARRRHGSARRAPGRRAAGARRCASGGSTPGRPGRKAGGVAFDLRQAGADDRGEAVGRGRVGCDRRFLRLQRFRVARMAQRVAALRLAQRLQCQRDVRRQRVREFVEPRYVARFQFEFDFADRRAQPPVRRRRRARRRRRCTASAIVLSANASGMVVRVNVGRELRLKSAPLRLAQRAAKRRRREAQRIEPRRRTRATRIRRAPSCRRRPPARAGP